MSRSDEAEVVARAIGGDGEALEQVVRLVQDPLYRLALRMLWRPADAEDATQEILIRVITRLASWRSEASLVTWAYRIGVNYLLNLRRQTQLEQGKLTFGMFGDELAKGIADADYAGPDAGLLADEVRLTCTQAMLQCLDRAHRVTYVLGEIFKLPGDEAAWILGASPAAYRKRLERARKQVRAFMAAKCGIINNAAACRCARRVEGAVASGRLDPRRPALATHPAAPGTTVAETARQIHQLHDAAAVMRSHPDYAAPAARTEAVLALLRSGRYPMLAPPSTTRPLARP
jgi:RNA polymerase sigma factor (sigma-70 family)